MSIDFLFVISILHEAEGSRELETWSHEINLIDSTSTASPLYCYRKRMETRKMKILTFDIKNTLNKLCMILSS